MKINGYETKLKKEITLIDNNIYEHRHEPRNKQYQIIYFYNDRGHIRPIWKGFPCKELAQQYLVEIEKLIKK